MPGEQGGPSPEDQMITGIPEHLQVPDRPAEEATPVTHGETVQMPDRSVVVDSDQMSDAAKINAMRRSGMDDAQISDALNKLKNGGEGQA